MRRRISQSSLNVLAKMAAERSKLLRVPAKSVWWLLLIFISFSGWLRWSPDTSQNGDRAHKAASRYQPNRFDDCSLFLSLSAVDLDGLQILAKIATERSKLHQGTSQIGLTIAPYFHLFQRLMLELYFCLRHKLTVSSLTWNVSLANRYETNAGGLEWHEMNDILTKTHTRAH